MDALAKVTALTQPDENKADQETGRPTLYDNAISTEYSHSVGIKKAPSASPRHAKQTHFSLLNPHTVTETISIHLQPVT
ncbi:hypothetical protein CIP107561_00350 [Corynebacterium diphtheriae]|nr:hypothetical protein CIP107561_00350 [Corynebacterium diphtheriae]